METKKDKRMLCLYTLLQRANEQRHLYSIRTTFISIMPIMIIGAFAVTLNNMPITAYQNAMVGIFGQGWQNFGALVFNATTQIVALMVVFGISHCLAGWYNSKRQLQIHTGIAGMISLACYVLVSVSVDAPLALPFTMTDVSGLFVAMGVAVLSTEMFIFLLQLQRKNKVLSDDPNIAVSQSFAAVMPALVVVTVFAVSRMMMVGVFGVREGFSALLYETLSRPFVGAGNSVGQAQLFNLSTHLMWMFGIHGNNVLDGVAAGVFETAMQQNVAAVAQGIAAPNMITKTLFDVFVYMGGSGTTLALLIALAIFGRARSYRMLFRYALPTSVFNINEPLIFGVPIVLNPIYAIPFIITPLVMMGITVLAMTIGLVPYTTVAVTWSTPIFISGYVSTGSIAGVLLQILNLVVAVLIYAPFVRLSESVTQFRFDRVYKKLVEAVANDYSPNRNMISRTDEIGAVARHIANQLEGAMTSGEMVLHYQPIVDARDNTLHGVEALLRWKHPQYGNINPMVTITLAEETGFVSQLGLWILEQAVAQRKVWNDQGIVDFHISVNASTHQLNDAYFSEHVVAILKKYGVPAHQLQVEITETAALIDNAVTQKNLAHLHKADISLAMDDFGVGHSSLLYLRTQSITTLKIDGALSREVATHSANLDIISTIHDLCKLLEVNTVIEFVDNQKQLDCLLGIGTFLIQGYYYSPALPGDEIPAFLTKLSKMELPTKKSKEESCLASREDKV